MDPHHATCDYISHDALLASVRTMCEGTSKAELARMLSADLGYEVSRQAVSGALHGQGGMTKLLLALYEMHVPIIGAAFQRHEPAGGERIYSADPVVYYRFDYPQGEIAQEG